MKSPIIFILGLVFAGLTANGQSGENSPFSLRGGISLSGETYSVDGIENRRPGYSYGITGNLSLNYGELSIPVSFTYRDAQFSYDYNFNRFGISPKYKWATLHLGWRSIRFSQYTMSGRSFFGAGLELNPGKLSVSAIRGKIQNPLAIRDSLVFGSSLIPIYDRQVVGGKIGIRGGRNSIEVIAMKVWDDEQSFQYPENYDQEFAYQLFRPKENVIAGLNFSFSPFRNLDIYANTAVSGFTGDVTDPQSDVINGSTPATLADIYTVNTSTNVDFAGDAGFNLKIRNYSVGIKARRVGSFYTTLASAFFPNDLQQLTFNAKATILKRKVTLKADVGLEQNNLSDYRTNTTSRVITNASINFNPSRNLFANLRYANFQTESENQVLQLNDTLRFISVTQQTSAFSGYTIEGNRLDIRINGSAFYNLVRDRSEEQQLDDIEVLSGSGSVGFLFKDLGLNLTPGIHYYRYAYQDIIQNRYGGNLKLSKSFHDKKMKASVAGSYSYNDFNNRNDGYVGFVSGNFAYRTSMGSRISLTSTYRISNSILDNNFNEQRTMLRYGQNF